MALVLNQRNLLILLIISSMSSPFISITCNAAADSSTDGIFEAHERGLVNHNENENQLKKAADIINAYLNREAENILLDIIKNDLPDKGKAYFLLGRLYKEEGSFDKAEEFLIKAVENYALLRDYALKLLVDVYVTTGEFEKAIETAQRIENTLLLQFAKQTQIDSLIALNKDEKAKEVFYEYIERYPEDWDYKLTFATLLNSLGQFNEAIRLYKDIYINAVPLSETALKELRILEADTFTKEEILQRADNLFKNNNYQESEAAYKEVLNLSDMPERERIKFRIGMCQFRQKKYIESANSFGLLDTPKAMYWQARSFYRANDMRNFNKIKNEFEKKYPDNKHLALLYLIDAEELRRKGELDDAEKSYKKVLTHFIERAEEALWGLAWMNYMSGNYETALSYFSKLTAYVKSREYYKYLYWKAKTEEILFKNCVRQGDSGESETLKAVCKEANRDFFSGLPADESFYGYLIKLRSSAHPLPEKIEISKPVKPAGKNYERIEALVFLSMRDEAVNEIVDSLKRAKDRGEFLYLGYMGIRLEEYKDIIAFAEEKNDREFLPYSYPLGFWDIVSQAAASENVDAHLIAALIREESRFDPLVVSWAGAIGLMQLMPSTANILKDSIKVRLKNSSELQDTRTNIFLGTHYFAQLIQDFKDVPLAIAAYNAGEKNLKDWMLRINNHDLPEFIENIPYKETRRHVKKVLKSYWQYRTINGLPVSAFMLQDSGVRSQDSGAGSSKTVP